MPHDLKSTHAKKFEEQIKKQEKRKKRGLCSQDGLLLAKTQFWAILACAVFNGGRGANALHVGLELDCKEKALVMAYFQSTPQKRRVLLLEDGVQGEQVA